MKSNNLANCVLEYWELLAFTPEEDLNLDTAAKEEESLINVIETEWTNEEKNSLQEAAQERIKGNVEIDPEDESLDRKLRFLTFIAKGRIDDMWML